MEIVISGAFPDSDELFKQNLIDALIHFSKVIVQSGYNLTFGAHPTFQNLLYEVVKDVDPLDFASRINMYVSSWYVNNDEIAEYKERFTLCVVGKEDDKLSSLTKLRKKMIQRKEVKALVCIGGRIKDDKRQEGMREELELARQYGIPVFVVGSVGGCSSRIAVEYQQVGWEKLNSADSELNQLFLSGIDYFSMAQDMINYLDLGD